MPRSSSGRRAACRTTRRPGSPPPRSIARSTPIRRRELHARKEDALAYEIENQLADAAPDLDAAIERAFDEPIGDDLLRLIFIACHPVLSREARIALTLRLLGGLTTDEIARAFLVPEPTIAQRIVRAKRTLAEARAPSRCRAAAELAARLASVLEVIYLIFNEGYAATAGDDWMRPALCEEALRLGRILAGLAPRRARGARPRRPDGDPGVAAAARGPAPDGEPVLLLDQDRSRWDRLLIRRGLAALERAEELAQRGDGLGPYALQAAIAACHARAPSAEATDWERIAALYDALAQRTPSPVVELNRAVALAMAFGPAAGLEVADALPSRTAARRATTCCRACAATCSYKLGRLDEARAEFERAASLTRNARERSLLARRAQECVQRAGRPH